MSSRFDVQYVASLLRRIAVLLTIMATLFAKGVIMSNKPNHSNNKDYIKYIDVSIENSSLRTINNHIQDRVDTLEKAICDALCLETVDAIHERLREAVRH